jgi:hypothetical protein
MKQVWIAIAAITILACKKDNNHNTPKSTKELLTQQHWINVAGGFDENGNGVIESNENALIDCEKNNTYIFNADGTGSIVDNPAACTPPIDGNFTWELTNDNEHIIVNQQSLSIVRITESDLLLKVDVQAVPPSFLLEYHH